jgi:formylglycine-generating enzyme required for sulfatase activity
VDRFSHLVICCAVHCLTEGRRELWERFNNDDNLLFRESDFSRPQQSEVFRTLWNSPNPVSRALVGRLALACLSPLEEIPLLDGVFIDGKMKPLSTMETDAINALLRPPSLPVNTPSREDQNSLAARRQAEAVPPGAFARQGTAVTPPPIIRKRTYRRVFLPLVAIALLVAGVLGWRTYQESRARHASEVAAAEDAVERAARRNAEEEAARKKEETKIASKSVDRNEATNGDSPPKTSSAEGEVRLQALELQTAEVGKPLSLDLSMTGDSPGSGDVEFTLAAGAPADATIDVRTGRFTWTPTQEQAGAKHEVTAIVRTSDGRKAQTTFSVTVSKPIIPSEKELAVDLGNGVKLELVLIPAGSFLMGAEDGWDETPAHRVKITESFWLGKYEVTLQQWQAVMGDSPSRFKDPKHPVEQVSWIDCQVFLDKLNAMSKGRGGKFVLPTEAEWEYACRAGSMSRYCFGDSVKELDEYASYSRNSRQTQSVGQKKPNPWGLYDMHGNVCEWCKDWYDVGYYANSPVDNPAGPLSGAFRVFRGGSYQDEYGSCRSAYRHKARDSSRSTAVGFRVCRLATDKTPSTATVSPSASETASSRKKVVTVDLGSDVELEMVLIPAGSFTIGSAWSNTLHKVNITKPFYLGKYEVTQVQWELLMGNNPSRFKDYPENPVEQVSWNDCQVFLGKLNEKFGEEKFFLPTEAQWEYACRATSGERQPREEANLVDDRVWHKQNSRNTAHPVGQKMPNAWGLYDMYGNVWEWCADWYGPRHNPESPTDDPQGPANGSFHVIRGGSFDDHRSVLPSRTFLKSDPSSYRVGFRVARFATEEDSRALPSSAQPETTK